MKKFDFIPKTKPNYNRGQNAEYSVALHLNGENRNADNIPHNVGGDVIYNGKSYQIKGYHATICTGYNEEAETAIPKYIADDKADGFIYATQNGEAYVFNRDEWLEFCLMFHESATRESSKNSKSLTVKYRLKREPKSMMEYLRKKVGK